MLRRVWLRLVRHWPSYHPHLLSQSRADQSFNVTRTERGSVGTSTSAFLPELNTQLGSTLGVPRRGRPVVNDLAIDGALTMDNLHLGGIRACHMHACRMHLLQRHLLGRVWSGGKYCAPLTGLVGRDLPEISGGRDHPEISGGRDRPETIEG